MVSQQLTRNTNHPWVMCKWGHVSNRFYGRAVQTFYSYLVHHMFKDKHFHTWASSEAGHNANLNFICQPHFLINESIKQKFGLLWVSFTIQTNSLCNLDSFRTSKLQGMSLYYKTLLWQQYNTGGSTNKTNFNIGNNMAIIL